MMPNLKIRRKHITGEIENIDDLPTLPQVAQHVIALSQDPQSSFRDLKKVIISDPPLAAKVLMMANSAYFHRRKSAETLEEAIFTIGLQNLIAICTSVGVLGAFDRWSKGHANLAIRKLQLNLYREVISRRHPVDPVSARPCSKPSASTILEEVQNHGGVSDEEGGSTEVP